MRGWHPTWNALEWIQTVEDDAFCWGEGSVDLKELVQTLYREPTAVLLGYRMVHVASQCYWWCVITSATFPEPLPLYSNEMIPSLQSAGTDPDFQTPRKRECKHSETGSMAHFSSSGGKSLAPEAHPFLSFSMAIRTSPIVGASVGVSWSVLFEAGIASISGLLVAEGWFKAVL